MSTSFTWVAFFCLSFYHLDCGVSSSSAWIGRESETIRSSSPTRNTKRFDWISEYRDGALEGANSRVLNWQQTGRKKIHELWLQSCSWVDSRCKTLWTSFIYEIKYFIIHRNIINNKARKWQSGLYSTKNEEEKFFNSTTLYAFF